MKFIDRRETYARRILRDLGVEQTIGTRWGAGLFLLSLLLLALVLVFRDSFFSSTIRLSGFATPFVTVGGFYLALRQWRHLRNEVSISGALERLDIVNKYFANKDQLSAVVAFFAKKNGPQWAEHLEASNQWACDMYVFMELDNLQYGLEKFRLGYSSAYQALRVLDLFAARGHSAEFLETACRLTKQGAGSYTQETVRIVQNHKLGTRYLTSSGKPMQIPAVTGSTPTKV